MPVPENIILQVRVNGGAWTSHEDDPDGIAVVANDVVEMRVSNDAGISNYLFQIYEYPTGFTLPAGWTQTPGSRIFHSTAQLPQSWTVPATSTTLGGWILRVVVNAGVRRVLGEELDAPDLIDTIGLFKAFPSGLKDLPFFEGDEFDQLRQGGIAAHKNNVRILNSAILSGGSGQNNDGENVGDGADVYKGMNGVSLQIRGIKGDGDRISTSVVNDNVVVAFDATGLATTGDLSDGDPDVVTAGFVFDDPTDDSDPGTNRIKFDNANVAAATRCYIDLVDVEGRTLTGLYDSIELGNLRIVGAENVTHWVEYSITDAPVSASGYRKLKIQHSSGPGGFVDEEAVRVQFTRLRRVVVGGDIFDYSWNPDDGGGDPGTGQIALNDIPEDATIAYVDSTANDAGNIDSFLLTCATGTLTITQASDVAIRHNYDVTGRTDQSGYVQFALVWKSGSGVFESGADVRVAFVRTGAISSSTGGDTWTFFLDSTTSDSEPAPTFLRLSSATASAASFAYIDTNAVEGDISGYLDALGSGTLKLTKKTTPGLWNTYDIVEVISPSGYRKLDLTWTDGTGNFANGDELWAAFGKGGGGSSATASGLGAVTNGFFKLSGDPTWNAGTTALDYQRLVWVPRWRRWIRLGYDTSDNLSWMRLNDEGSVLSSGSWASEADVASATWTGPILACTGPVAATERVFVAAGRTTGETALHLRYSDDAGATWNAAELNTATEPSFPGAMVWTGTNLVLAFNTGEIEYGADPNTAWTVATPPDSGTRCQAITDGLGKVLIFRTGASASYAYSANHGVTWITGTLPGSFTVFGAVYHQGNFIVLTTGEQVTRSVDGTTWSSLSNVSFADPSTAVTMQFATGDQYASRVVSIGALLVAPARDTGGGSVVDDLYYSSDLGTTWYRSGSFSHDIINAVDGVHQHLAVGDMQLAVLGFDQSSWLSHRDTGGGSGSGGGEANLLASVGDGEGELPAGKTGVTLLVKSIKQGPFITVTNDAQEVVIEGDEAEIQALIDASLSDVAGADVDASAAFAGDVDKAARENHTHQVQTGTPGELTDLVPEAGTADTLMRSDAQLAHGERAGGTLHPIASDATGDGFVPSTDGVDGTWVLGINPGTRVAEWVEPVEAPEATEGLLPSDSNPLDIVSDGTEGPGDGTLGSRWNHTHAIPKLFLIKTEADLPAPDGSNIIHITEDGLYRFVNQVDLANATRSLARSVIVDAGVNADFESAVADVSTTNPFVGLTTNADRPTLTFSTLGGTHRRPFLVLHQQTDQYAVVGPTEICEFQNWRVGSSGTPLGFKVRGDTTFGECLLYSRVVVAESCDYLEVNGGRSCGVTLGTGSGGHLGMVKMTGVNPVDGVSGTLFEAPDDNGLFSQGVYLTDCHAHATGKLFDIGNAFNQATGIPALVCIGCSGESVTLDSMPDGGVTIDGCRFRSATPFGGTAFDAEPHLTEGVTIRACYRAGSLGGGYSLEKFPETPNGHRILDENDDPVAQQPKLQFPGATVANVGDVTQVTITGGNPTFATLHQWSTTTAQADPGQPFIRGDNATQSSILELYIDDLDAGGNNVRDRYLALVAGQCILLASVADDNEWRVFRLTSNAIPQTGYTELRVVNVDGDGTFDNNDSIWLRTDASRSLSLSGGEMDDAALLDMNRGQITEIDALYVDNQAGSNGVNDGLGAEFMRSNPSMELGIEILSGQGLRTYVTGQAPSSTAGVHGLSRLHHLPIAGSHAITVLGRPMQVTGSNSYAIEDSAHAMTQVVVSGAQILFTLDYSSATVGPFGHPPGSWTGKMLVEGILDLALHTTVSSIKGALISVRYTADWASRNVTPTVRTGTISNLAFPYTVSVTVSGTAVLFSVATPFIPSGGARISGSLTGRIRAMAVA